MPPIARCNENDSLSLRCLYTRMCAPETRQCGTAVETAPGLSCRNAGDIAKRPLVLFLLVREVAHGSRWEQEAGHATYRRPVRRRVHEATSRIWRQPADLSDLH